MDKIVISNLKVFCHHGVYEEEQINGQNFYVTAVLFMDTHEAGMTDDLTKSVNYAELCHDITKFMKENRYDLIEAVAEKLSEHILLNYPLIKEIKLTISKPEAPIGLPFENVCVEIERKWTTAYIAFGSNMGDSQSIIKDALNKIASMDKIRLIKTSSIIKTAPYGGIEQDDFLNGCIEIETIYSADDLLTELNRIESEAGRTREIHWGPRTLDLDIIMYGEEIIHTKNLIVPHIDMQNRQFVLEPLNEIAPYAYHPVLGKTVGELWNIYKIK